MTRRSPVRQQATESRATPEDLFQWYEISIGGAYKRPISGAAALETFRRWRERPDILMDGDLQTGFYWQWPDMQRTKVMVTPVIEESATAKGTNASCSGSASLPASGEQL